MANVNDPRQHAITLKLKGLSYAEIGVAMGFSRQRAQQLVRPPIAIYRLVKNRAHGKCEECGIKIKSGHVHHRSSEGEDYNDTDNLVYLCVSCHTKKHPSDGGMRKPVCDSATAKALIKMLRREQGKRTQTEYARALGISAAYLSDIYKGRRNPGPKVLDQFGLEKRVTISTEYAEGV